ncbi:MAG: hypothetical protein M3P18_08370 [Actinomycetota bacterium]|nr:hypothetical protein [Actinomycetota bacterium]
MADWRLERLRQIDAAAADPWWPADGINMALANRKAANTARNILPATIELLDWIQQEHYPDTNNANGYCPRCHLVYPCPVAERALAVLDQVGEGD